MERPANAPSLAFLKLLVSNSVAGSIIGKSGSEITGIESETGASIRLSSAKQYYPGTEERIVIMSGEMEQVEASLAIILEKIREHADDRPGLRLVLPKSSVSAIIGKRGSHVKQLQETTSTQIRISQRDEALNERIVTITGPWESVHRVAVKIFEIIQSDPNVKNHEYIHYSKDIYKGLPVPYSTWWPQTPDILMQYCQISFLIPDDCVGSIMGRNGSSIIELMKNTNTKIKISPKETIESDTKTRQCQVFGTVLCVHNAHALILRRIKHIQMEYKKKHNWTPEQS